jgi:hypothetical protein
MKTRHLQFALESPSFDCILAIAEKIVVMAEVCQHSWVNEQRRFALQRIGVLQGSQFARQVIEQIRARTLFAHAVAHAILQVRLGSEGA